MTIKIGHMTTITPNADSAENGGVMVLVACKNQCDVRCSSELIESCSLEKYVCKRLGRKVPGVCLFKRSHKPRYCPGTELELAPKFERQLKSELTGGER